MLSYEAGSAEEALCTHRILFLRESLLMDLEHKGVSFSNCDDSYSKFNPFPSEIHSNKKQAPNKNSLLLCKYLKLLGSLCSNQLGSSEGAVANPTGERGQVGRAPL